MLSRSKIKMQDSFKQIHQNLPYFPHDEPTYGYKTSKQVTVNKAANNNQAFLQQQTKYGPYRSDFSQDPTRNNATRNQILKELRQQYEILRNLSVEESVHIPVKKYEQTRPKYDQRQSDLSSSMHSKQSKGRDVRSPKQGNREVQSLHLQKKQLELVIGNSMRKIQELLNNEISLKKTIHELKSQIQGKGGITMEYEKTIRGLQKSEEQLQNQLTRVKHQNQKSSQRIRELGDKIRVLETQLEKKERETKQGFDEQRRIHELLRIQKDKYLNLQIQCRSYKMQFEMLEKQKNNQINRLVRQFQVKDGGNQKEMAYIIKKLEDEVKQKDRRYHELQLQREKRREKDIEPVAIEKKNEKNYLEELLYKSREMNEHNNKAFTQGMNLIVSKMAQLQKRNDESLRKQIEQIRRKADEVGARKVSYDGEKEKELYIKIAQLERNIDREISEKNKLITQIKSQNDQRLQLQQRNRYLQKTVKQLQQKESQLLSKINHFDEQLEALKLNNRNTQNQHNNLKSEHAVYVERLKEYERMHDGSREAVESQISSFRQKEKKYQEQIRVLKRRVDEAQFQADKNKKQGDFNLNIYKTSMDSQSKRINAQNARLALKLKQTEERLHRLQRQSEGKLKVKEGEVTDHRTAAELLRAKLQEQLTIQKKHYEERITHIETRHASEMKTFSEKFIGVTAANEKLMQKLAVLGGLESQVLELRRLLRGCRSVSSGIDHLWEIKETQYQNIRHILKTAGN